MRLSETMQSLEIRYKIFYVIITILIFASCKNESSKIKNLSVSETSNVIKHLPSYKSAFLDTTIIVSVIKNTVISKRHITKKEAEATLYKYFKSKGVVNRSEMKSASSSDEDKTCVSYDTLYQIHSPKFLGAIISYYLGECDLNGICFQPNKAIIMWSRSGYKISHEDFIPSNFVIDSSVESNIYGYAYECGTEKILSHFKVTLQ